MATLFTVAAGCKIGPDDGALHHATVRARQKHLGQGAFRIRGKIEPSKLDLWALKKIDLFPVPKSGLLLLQATSKVDNCTQALHPHHAGSLSFLKGHWSHKHATFCALEATHPPMHATARHSKNFSR